jgi:hypothetical protein
MFLQAHAGIRHLWPVIFFLPWLIIGVVFLVESVLHRSTHEASRSARMRTQSRWPGSAVDRERR